MDSTTQNGWVLVDGTAADATVDTHVHVTKPRVNSVVFAAAIGVAAGE